MQESSSEVLELDVRPDAVNAVFWPLIQCTARFLLLWGSRDSSKSDFVALLLLLKCLVLPYFKCILIRKVFGTVGASQVATLKKVAEREGIDHLFFWGISPLEIRCLINKNSFIARGLDNPAKLKSISDPTHAWYEEGNEVSEEEANFVSTSLRSSYPGSEIQEIYTFNPDHAGDYKQFWLYQKFFERTGHAHELSFTGQLVADVDGQAIAMPYVVQHSTYQDNRWCPPERAALYESYQFTDPYRYRVWALGLWATKRTDNEFYPRFSRAIHVQPTAYLPGLPIVQSWDANALPYCAMFCAQQQDLRSTGGKLTLRVFQEYAIRSPNAGIRSTGKQFLLDRTRHGWSQSAVMLTGDASLRARKVGEEKESNFADVQAAVLPALNGNSAALWPRRNPEVMRRRDFINYLLAGGIHDVQVQIDSACAELIADMELTQVGIDGKLKEKFNDKPLGVTYEIRGHFTDVFEYYITTVLSAQYEAFKAGRDG